MRFRFRLETVMRQRKAEQDMAQREYHLAQANVQEQLNLIKRMYSQVDDAREMADKTAAKGGAQAQALAQFEEFIIGQQEFIKRARQKARELMQIAEEKLEILTEKMQSFKVLEKLKEKQKEEFKLKAKKKELKEIDDISIMRAAVKKDHMKNGTQI